MVKEKNIGQRKKVNHKKLTNVFPGVGRDLFHAGVETRVAHAMSEDSRELAVIDFHSKVSKSWT